MQGLFAQGAIELDAAIPVLFGDNIGTTITAVIASIGTSVAAKRAAYTHVTFNLIGAVIFMILLFPFTNFVSYLETALNLNKEMTIAFAHGSYNVANTIIQFPFIGFLAWLITKLVPGDDVVIEYKPKHLDSIFLQQSSSLALAQAKLKYLYGEICVSGIRRNA